MKVLVTGANGYIGRHVVKALIDKGAEVIACDIVTTDVDERAERKTLNLFELPEGNVYEHLGSPDVCLHMAWRNGFVHNAPTQIGDLSAHYKFLTAMIDGGLKQLAVMGTMHEVGYWEGAIDENTPCNPISLYGIAKDALRRAMILYCKQKECILQWLRCYYILGDDKKNNSIFCKLLLAAEEGKKTFPFTTGKNQYDFITVDMTDAQLKENEGKKYWACKFDVFNDNRFCYTSFTKSIKNGNTFYRYDSSWADTFRYLIKPYNLSEFMDLGLVSDLAYDPEHFLTTLVDYDYSKILEDRAIAQFWEPFAKNRISTYDKTVKRNIEIDLFAADEHLLVVGPGMDDNLLLFNIVKIIVQPILKAVIKEHKKSKDYNEGTELDKFTSDFIEWIATSDLTFRADLLQHFKDPNNSFWEKVEYVWDKLSERVEKYVMDQLYDTASETAVVLLFEESGKLALKAH